MGLSMALTLRPYQQHTIELIYEYFRTHPQGDPCAVLPTGSGKSVIIAAFIRSAIEQYPETRVLMLTHVRELIQQNAEKLRTYWPNAPLGVYSAGIGRREVDQVTFAGIQSVRGKADKLGHVHLCIVDEAHLISHRDEGGYRQLIKDLREINPRMRVIGLTATPYRLGHGLITEGDALFSELIEPVTIRELIYGGYLAPLVSRATDARYSTDGVHKRGGEYIEKELQEAVDTADQNVTVAREIVALAGDRRSWLVFCAGVQHAYHMRDSLRAEGVEAETITGETPKVERDEIVARFKSGAVRAITNAMVLTTGFDHPDVDLIALLRPTMSPGLYMQMVGRGFRVKSHADHCLVLDFAGVVAMHGPITAVDAPDFKVPNENGEGIAPSKECPRCHWIVAAAVRHCINPLCGHEFIFAKPKLELRDDDIMGDGGYALKVDYWTWDQKRSKSDNEMIVVSYYGGYSDPVLREYLLLWDHGFAGQKSRKALQEIADGCGVLLDDIQDGGHLNDVMEHAPPPATVRYKRDGKYLRVLAREWAPVMVDVDDDIPF